MKWILLTVLLVVTGLLVWVKISLPAQIEASANVTQAHVNYAIGTDSAQLHERLFIADLHSDALLWNRDLMQRSELGHTDLSRLAAGNVALQLFSAVTKSPAGQNYQQNSAASDNITLLAMSQLWPLKTWFSLYERALFQAAKLSDLERRAVGQLRVLRSKADLEAVIAARVAGSNVTGGIFVIEGGHALEGDLGKLQNLYDAGLRVIGMTHFFDNALGGSLHGLSGEGLSEFGRQVLQKANDLELIIDVAHAPPQMVKDILAGSARPVILSHGGVKGICDQGRNLDDALMQQLAGRGVLFGVGFWGGAVCDISPESIVQSIRYAIDLMGIEHVALGSDFDGSTTVSFDASELAILTQTMLQQGFSETEIRKVMGENARDFFLANLPNPSIRKGIE